MVDDIATLVARQVQREEDAELEDEVESLIQMVRGEREPSTLRKPWESTIVRAIRDLQEAVRPSLRAMADYRQTKALHRLVADEYLEAKDGEAERLLKAETERFDELLKEKRTALHQAVASGDTATEVTRLALFKNIQEHMATTSRE